MLKKKYQYLIFALVFVGILLSSFHYHEDMQTTEDCPVCIIQHLFAAADIPEHFILGEVLFFILLPLSALQRDFSLKPVLSFSSRAPPSFF